MGNTSDNNGHHGVAAGLGWLVGSLSLALTPSDWDWLVARAQAVAQDGDALAAVEKEAADFAAVVVPRSGLRC